MPLLSLTSETATAVHCKYKPKFKRHSFHSYLPNLSFQAALKKKQTWFWIACLELGHKRNGIRISLQSLSNGVLKILLSHPPWWFLPDGSPLLDWAWWQGRAWEALLQTSALRGFRGPGHLERRDCRENPHPLQNWYVNKDIMHSRMYKDGDEL